MRRIIGLKGKEDVVRQMAWQYDSEGYIHMDFRNSIIRMLVCLHGHTFSIKDEETRYNGLTAQEMVWSLEAWGRQVNPQIWIDSVERHLGFINKFTDKTSPVVIICRHYNESLWVESQGGSVITIGENE